MNLSAEASPEATREAVQNLVNKSKKAESDLVAMTEKHETVNKELVNLKKANQEKADSEIVNYVGELIKLDKRNEDKKESLINMAKNDFETFKTIMPLKKAVVNGEQVDEGIEEKTGDADVKKLGIENAQKFFDMPLDKKEDLKNENLKEYKQLVKDYEEYSSEIK